MKHCKYFLALLLLLVTRCSRLDTTGADDATDADLIVSSTIAAGQALNANPAREGLRTTACSSISFGACDAGTLTRTRFFSALAGNTDGCLRGTAGSLLSRTVFGAAVLTYDGIGCVTTTGHTVTRTLTDYYSQQTSGRKILEYTSTGTVDSVAIGIADLTDYEGMVRSGGSVLTITGAASRSLSISGVHRRVVQAAGTFGFWHTIYTSSPVLMTVNAGTSTLASGTVVVQHNRVEKTATTDLSGVTFSSTCCYPTQGTVTTTVTSADASPVTLTSVFSPVCGAMTLNGITTTLPTCGD